MPPRVKKIFGSLAICVFVLFWMFLTVSLSGFVPKNVIAETGFYIFMGLAWAFPLMPVLKWMEKT